YPGSRARQGESAQDPAPGAENGRRNARGLRIPVAKSHEMELVPDSFVGLPRLPGKGQKHATTRTNTKWKHVSFTHRITDGVLGFDPVQAGAQFAGTDIEGDAFLAEIGQITHYRQKNIGRHH